MSAFQIIRPTSLQFVLRYGGVPNAEMIKRIEAAGRQVSDYAKEIASRFENEPEEKEVRITAPLLSEWFSECPTTDAIFGEAKERKLEELHPSVGLHLALLYVEQPKDEWVRIGHKPIPGRGGYPIVLFVGHDDGGRWLNADFARPGNAWDLDGRFAFGVPASQS